MKEQYVRDLPEGARVDSLFALHSRDIRSARTGEPYLSLEIGDNSGRMPAVMFRPSPVEESLPIGSVVRLRGTVTTFRGVRRVTVESLGPVAAFDAADMLPASAHERSEMVGELRALVRAVREPRLRALLRAVFGAPGFIETFSTCPAGTGRHHAYVGGLLEHTLAVAALCVSLSAVYPQADADILLAAALLHDVGKTEELSCATSLEYTDAGRLVGHVVLGERIVSRAIGGLSRPLPAETALRLCHAILAHHGEPEWGAARRPSTLEALLLHHADNLDAHASAFLGAVTGAAVLGQSWSDCDNSFGRPLVVPSPASGGEGERNCA
jgi:3'-5' exoribonuclease